MKRFFRTFLIIAALCSMFAVTVAADTTKYYFNLSGGETDMTKRTVKAGGGDYEAVYYVRPTHFSRNQNYKVRPHRIITENNRPKVGDTKTIYWYNKDKLSTFAYTAACPANNYYYLFAEFVDGPTAQPIYVEGRYTP